ncbi:aminoadipate-semialdehyde dehydrogenase isoform X2 [Andrena cerasifolii]
MGHCNSTNERKKLHDICNWNELDNVIIEYHDLQGIIICITYRELLAAKVMLSDHLKSIQSYEFIGINFDIPEYCVVSLILGILASEHSFVNIPLNPTDYINLRNTLHISYLFSKQISAEGDIVNQFNVHGECIYLIKLKHVHRRAAQNVQPNCYAYAITTSGSTGAPVVVRVSHSCIVPNILDLRRILAIEKSDKIAQFTSLTFDPSIIEIFLALSSAGSLFMVSKTLKNDTNRLLQEAYSRQITILQMTPSVFLYSFTVERLKATILSDNTSLRVLLLGGEPFPKLESLLETKHPHNSTKVYNIYGITEVSCWASVNEVVTTSLPCHTNCLGQALSQTILQVRDETGEVVKNGTGILHIGSNSRVCVLNDESVGDLELPVFRDTGDIVNIDEEGRIFYKGRKNGIIKRFGHKVDLTKLEEFASQVKFVKSCYVLWDESNHKLHLCLATKEKATTDPSMDIHMAKHLDELPHLYRPDKIHFLEHFELTSSGKISAEFLKKQIWEQTTHSALSKIDIQKLDGIFKCIWGDHLKHGDDGFMNLGGTSITALQISNSMSDKLSIEFPELIGMLLNNATAKDCLSYIQSTVSNNEKDETIRSLECQSSNTETIPLINIAKEDKVSPKHVNEGDQDSDPIQTSKYEWHKCRGEICNSAAIANERHYDRFSRIEILKTCNLQKCVDASPTVFHYSDGNTYVTVGSHSGFISTLQLDKESYIPTFRTRLPGRIEASVLILDDFKGIVGKFRTFQKIHSCFSIPCFAGCYDGNVYCLHLKTGEIFWKYQTGDIVKCSAIFCKQRQKVFVGSYDCYVYCLSAKDGAEIWKAKISNGSISASGCLHSATNSILFGTLNGSCLALEQLTGKMIWNQKLSDPVFVAPVVLNTGLILFCSVTGTLSCFDIEVNVEMWKYKIKGNVFSYVVKENDAGTDCESIVVASQNKSVYYFQSDTGFKTEPTLKYVLNLHSPIFATPWRESNILLIACTDGTLYIYNFTTKRLTKTEKLPGEVFSSPVVHSNIAIIGCRDNNVYVAKLV